MLAGNWAPGILPSSLPQSCNYKCVPLHLLFLCGFRGIELRRPTLTWQALYPENHFPSPFFPHRWRQAWGQKAIRRQTCGIILCLSITKVCAISPLSVFGAGVHGSECTTLKAAWTHSHVLGLRSCVSYLERHLPPQWVWVCQWWPGSCCSPEEPLDTGGCRIVQLASFQRTLCWGPHFCDPHGSGGNDLQVALPLNREEGFDYFIIK